MDFIKFEKIIGKKIHYQAHRKLIHFDSLVNEILKCFENNEKFYLVYLYSPTKPSLNLNDVNQFLILKWLQSVFNVPVIIHINDNHRFLKNSIHISEFSELNINIKDLSIKYFLHLMNKSVEDINKMPLKQLMKELSTSQGHIKEEYKMKFIELISMNCIKEIISVGFNQDQTFICRNLKYIGQCPNYYETIIKLGSKITFRQSLNIGQANFSDDIETLSLVAKDMAALFVNSYPQIFNRTETNVRGLIVNLNEKQLSLSRRLAQEMKWPKPAALYIEAMPALHGNGPMDSCGVNSAIFFHDTEKIIRNKINKFAFSGGRDTIEEHKRLGGNCDVDVSYQYLRYLLDDQDRIESIREQYQSGTLLTGDLKKETVSVIVKLLSSCHENMKNVNDEIVKLFMTPRLLNFGFLTGVADLIDDDFVVDDVLKDDLSLITNTEKLEEKEENEQEQESVVETGDIVTPWEVVGNVDTGIDYDKLIEQYGSSKIDQDLVDRFERVTGKKAHHLLKRGMFYSHRDFNEILDLYEKRQPFFLYTGRGPSSDALHLGHMIPFIFTKWLQDIFDVPLVIQLTDDEKCLMRNISTEDVRRMAIENVKDIIAIGFDAKNTFIFSDFEYVGQEPAFFETSIRVGCKVNFNTVKSIFGFTVDDSVEKIVFPSKQAAPSFGTAFPAIFGTNHRIKCLIPCAIDQDPYFRMTRDVAPRLNMPKPGLIHSRFFPSLQGNQTKMNASDPNSAIFMTDSMTDIHDKIMNHAFTVSEERKKKLSADEICRYDICYQYLTFFLADEEKLDFIKSGLQNNSISDTYLKQELIQVLSPFVAAHKARREMVTDEVVRQFMTPRPLT